VNLFRDHVEAYRVAERLYSTVTAVGTSHGMLQVTPADGIPYEARSVIYAAGNEYRRLGVPKEDCFIGKGISFCATCDAPLFRGKAVAVVGGGNSAFTAARDLANCAAKIHIVHMLDEFHADPALVAEVKKAPNVTFHKNAEVRELLGRDRLSGIRVSASDGKERYDLLVDGVFLEIGLVPNSDPVKNLLKLNAQGEIPVGRDQTTGVPGLFTAGDVTDEPDKQIVIAAGAGARAALSADGFLSRQRLGAAALAA
jgi:NADH-dependent peroxiredoxin subunit F